MAIERGRRILDRLEMRRDVGVRHDTAKIRFDLLRAIVRFLHAPCARHQDMKRNECARARLARAQRVERESACAVLGEEGPQPVRTEGMPVWKTVTPERFVGDDKHTRGLHATVWRSGVHACVRLSLRSWLNTYTR